MTSIMDPYRPTRPAPMIRRRPVSGNLRPQTAPSAARYQPFSTLIICVGLAFTAFALPDDSPNSVFGTAAVGVGISLALAFAVEARSGLRAMLRTDVVMLSVLYVLTFFEFLFPQPALGRVLPVAGAIDGTYATLIGFAGLAVGRHLSRRRFRLQKGLGKLNLSPNKTIQIFFVVFLVGYFHMFLAVNFNIFELLDQMSRPRFAQSWSRGQLGGLSSLLNELGALIYLIPPLAGFVFARAREFGAVSKIFVTLVLVLTLYYGFAGGTRHVFAIYFITFISSILIFKRRLSFKYLLTIGVPALCVLLVALFFMLQFRQVGLSNYSGEMKDESLVFVDYNLLTISQLTQFFPQKHSYLGLEVPYNALIKPIPRAIWPGKPTGLSITIEDALGVWGYTLAATFVGEAYISGGLLAVAIAGLLFGAAAANWNRVGQDLNSNFKLILYVSGFLCAAITMRSALWATTAALPTIGFWVIGKYWLKQHRTRRLAPYPVPRGRPRHMP